MLFCKKILFVALMLVLGVMAGQAQRADRTYLNVIQAARDLENAPGVEPRWHVMVEN